MQKGFSVPLLLLVAVLMIGGFIGYFTIQKSPQKINLESPKKSAEDSANFKTYTNKNLGFEFQYTEDISLQEDSEEDFNQRAAGSASKSVNGDFRKNFKGYVGYEPGKFLGAVVLLEKANSYDQNPFTVWVFDNPEDLNIDKWYGNFWYYPFVWGDFTYTGKFTLAPKEDATVSGQLGKFGIIDYQPGKPKFIYLSKDKKMYLFRIIEEAGDQILPTFKFI